MNCLPPEIWKDIKRVAKWMYEQDVKGIDKENLLIVIKSGDVFIRILRQAVSTIMTIDIIISLPLIR